MTRTMVSGYLIVGLPLQAIYFLLIWLTDLHGKMLLYCLLPAAVILTVIYILYLTRPAWLLRWWVKEEIKKTDHG